MLANAPGSLISKELDVLTKMLKETPLAEIHRESGARMVNFAGWNMPVQYRSIIKEHMAVRQAVGLFDVSHMGEFIVAGKDAKAFLQYLIANDIDRLKEANTALYTQFVNEKGGTVDDLIVYRRENDYLLVVNAGNIEKDWAWIQEHKNKFDVEIRDDSERIGLLALQGPHAAALMAELAGEEASKLSVFHYGSCTIDGVAVNIARTGYTGEDGFEIFVVSSCLPDIWKKIIAKGQSYGIEPCGLGARDTLRLEAALPLYDHELDDNTSPLAAGLGFSVSLNKSDFIGKDKLLLEKKNGPNKKLVCLVTESKALPRQGYTIKAESNGEKIGIITSGSQGIAVGHPIAMGYVEPQFTQTGKELYVEIRGEDVPAQVVQRPFYKAKRNNS